MDRAFKTRLAKLREQMAAARLDAALLAHLPNLFYFTGFAGSAGLLLVRRRSATLFTDGRYRTQARAEVVGAKVRVPSGSALKAVAKRLGSLQRARIGIEAHRLTLAEKSILRRHAGAGNRWVEFDRRLAALRACKDAVEIGAIRDAGRTAVKVIDAVTRMLKPGVRELDIAAEIDYRMRRLGASGPAFETIVAFGRRSALPHARPTGKRLRRNELVVLDLGAILRRYCSDLTRTMFVGRASQRLRGWYRAVWAAQEAAVEAARPGVFAEDVDAAARRVLRRDRLDRYFVHSTGHGLGLEVHEEPRLARGQKSRLEVGNVVTIEPGIYVEGVGGIRVEDDIGIGPRGAERLTAAPRELLEI